MQIEFGEDGTGTKYTSQEVRKALKQKGDGESLLRAVRRIANGIPYQAVCAPVPTQTQNLATFDSPRVLVRRFGAKEKLAEHDYSECPYHCQGCNRKAIAIILKRDEKRCQGCGKTFELSIHHIKPRAEGGDNAPENLITLCCRCHDYVEMHESKPRTKDAVTFLAANRPD